MAVVQDLHRAPVHKRHNHNLHLCQHLFVSWHGCCPRLASSSSPQEAQSQPPPLPASLCFVAWLLSKTCIELQSTRGTITTSTSASISLFRGMAVVQDLHRAPVHKRHNHNLHLCQHL